MSQSAPISIAPAAGGSTETRRTALLRRVTAGRLLWRMPVLLALGAFLLVAAAAFRYTVDVPYLCQWWFVYDLRHFYEGNLQLGHLWWQHNEHRIMFPKIILLPLARLTGWNTAYEVGLNLACSGLSFLFMVYAVRRIVPWRRDLVARWFLPVAAAGFFSLAPWEAWLWGWTLQIYLNIAAAMGGIFLLSAPRITAVRFAGAIACGIVASYSFANGLIYWFAALPLLVFGGDARLTGRRRMAWAARLVIWAVFAGGTIALFFFHYHFREERPLALTFETAVSVIRYLTAFLGAPLRPRSFHQSQFFGAIGFAVLAGGSLYLRRRLGRSAVRRLAGVWALALYPILSAVIAVPGRVQAGDGAFNISRHLYIAAPFWVAVYAILFAVICVSRQNAENGIRQRSRLRTVAGGLTVVLIATHVWGSVRTLPEYQRYSAEISQSKDELVSMQNGGTLGRIHNNPDRVIELGSWLREQKLSVFRHASTAP